MLPAVGYTHADQSHFTSRHYWEVGATEANLRTGWIGRYLDRVGKKDNPLQGLSLDDTLAPALATAKVPVASISGADQYNFYSERVWGEVEQRMLEAIGLMGHQPADAGLRTAGNVAAQVDRLRRQLIPFQSSNGFGSPVPYPQSDDPFPQRLAGLAAMLAAGLPLHCVALTAPGEYDTHADEPSALTQGLQLTADSLLAFQRDLEARGLANRVLVHVWSEFGRRAAENGDSGTDHGAAGVGFLVGTRVTGKMVGEFPGLQKGLDSDGNVVRHVRLPRCLRVAARAVVRRRCRRRDPERLVLLPAEARGVILAPQAPRPPARVQVVAQEFRYSLSRTKVRSGRVIVELVNRGQDTHDLDIAPRGRDARLPLPGRPAGPGRRPRAEARPGPVQAVVRHRGSQRAWHARVLRVVRR